MFSSKKFFRRAFPVLISLLVAFPFQGFSAITEANLAGSSSTSNASSYTTASQSPTANRLQIAVISNSKNGGTAGTPTITANGLTWVQIDTQLYASNGRRVTMFRSMGASPTSGTAVIDFGGVSQNNCAWSFFEFDGIDTSGTNGSGAIVQSNKNTASAATSISITLSAFGSVNNATASGFGVDNNLAITPRASWTEIIESQISDGADSVTNETQWIASNDTTASASWTGNQNAGGIAIEIKAAGAAPTAKPTRTLTGVGQ